MKTKLILLTFILIALFLAGCARLGGATDETAACPEPAPETELLENEQLGYCLLYPDNYMVESHDNGDTLVIDSVMNHVDPRFNVAVEDAGGRTAADAAGEMSAGLPEDMATPSTLTLDGEEAVVLDNYPGQEISRFVFVVHEDRLYRLMVTHTAAELGETYTQAQNLYTVVTNSFRFLPQQ